MRFLVLFVVALLLPLSGCLGGGQPVVATIFSDWTLPRGDPAPVPAVDCDDLLSTLNTRAIEESDTALKQALEGHGRYYAVADRAFAFEAADTAPAAASAGSGASARDAEVTGTNNQEAGADESDIMKTDGEWTYVVRGRSLYILHSENVGDVAQHARIELEGHGIALLLDERGNNDPSDDRLVLVTRPDEAPETDEERSSKTSSDRSDMRGDFYDPYRHTSWTKVQVLGLADRGAPAVLHEAWVEGRHVTARLIDGHAYVVVQAHSRDLQLQTWVHPDDEDLQKRGMTHREFYDLPEERQKAILSDLMVEARVENRLKVREATLEDHVPRVVEGRAGRFVDRTLDDAACNRFLSPPDATGRATTTVLAVDVQGARSETTSIVGSSPIVYGAPGALVLAGNSRDMWWFWDQPRVDEATDLQWFDLDGLAVTHRASGRIPGTILDSFSIDVEGDQLRVATTTGQWGRWWVDAPEPMVSHVMVLKEEAGLLVPSGIVGGIAPGERIWSARFTEDRAYIVTFEQIDPLWVIDLSDPTLPQILGELEIPGVSTYIHPLSDDLLLTIGYGPGRDGRGLDWSRVQLSLFDISDPTRPTRADLLDISPPDGGGWSDATREHKAFTYWDALGVLAVPMNLHYEVETRNGFDYRYRNVLRLIDVDEATMTLSVRGDVDQDSLQGDEAQHRYWRGGIERSYFLGYPGTPIVSVYALSPSGVTAHDLRTLADQGSVAFEEEQHYGYCCWEI